MQKIFPNALKSKILQIKFMKNLYFQTLNNIA